MSTSDSPYGDLPAGDKRVEIVDSVRRLIAAAILYSHKVSEELKLGPSDAQFMTLLEVHGPLTPGRFAELTGLKTGTVTGVLDRLENAGLVRRDRDPHDRRKVIVSAVEEQTRERVHPQYRSQAEHMFRLLERYDDAQLDTIADFLRAARGPN